MEEVVEQKKKRGFAFNFRASLCIPYGVFMVLFVIFPLFLIVYYAFTDANGVFTFSNWGKVFTAENWKTIWVTFGVSSVTTIICILIAYPIAYLLANKKYNKNKVLVYIFLLPMWINFVIRTVGLKELVNSLFSKDLTANYPFIGVIIGMVYDYLPFAILPLYNQMLKLDKNQIEAAADLGANPTQVFIKSIIPQTIPGIVSACTMTFMPTMSSYVIANKMSESKLQIIGSTVQDYFLGQTAPGHENLGSVLSLTMLIIVGVSLLVEKKFSEKPEERKGNLW